MPKSTEQVNLDLEDLLVSKGYEVTSRDSSGKEVPTADTGEIQQFHFHRDGKDYGTVTISIDGLKNMTVYYDDEIANSGVNEDDMDADRGMNGTSWISLVKQLKKFAQRHQLGFVLKDADRLRIDMKRRKQTEKELREGAELKKVKREYNQAAKNAGGDFDGAGKKIDDKKKGLRQKDIGKDKTVVEGSEPVTTGTNKAGRELFWVEMNHKNPARSMDGIGRPDNGSEGRSVGFVIRDDQGKWREMPSDIGRVPYGFGDVAHGEELSADEVFREIKNRLSKSGTQVRPIEGYPSKQMKLDEGYYGNRKMSYSDDTPQVKMIIKHNRQLEETDQRFRHIEKIFLETSDGERFGVPTNKPSRARMFARHIAEGGGYKDERWNHIAEISEDIDNLGGFIRATRSSDQFTESAQRMIGEAVDKYHELRETAKRLCSGRGYNSYFESYEPAVENDNDDDLLEVFKHSSVDSRIEKAMPTLNKLGIRRGKLEEADMFEQWADSIIDESLDIGSDRQSRAIIELFSDELPVGPNAEVAIGELSDIIEDDTLFDRLRRAASVDPNSDARPQIIAWMQEQEDPEYRELLSKLDIGEENSEEAEVPKPEAEQPEEPQPEEPTPEPQDDETLPMKETDNSLKNIKRLSGL